MSNEQNIVFSVTYRTVFLVEAAFTLSLDILVWFMNVEKQFEWMVLFILNAVSGVGVGTILAIIYPVAPAEATILCLSLCMISVGINQLSLAWLVRPSDYFGSYFMVLIGMSFIVRNLDWNIGTFIVLFIGMCLVMYGVQMIFFGVGLLRKYGTGEYGESPVAATSTAIDV